MKKKLLTTIVILFGISLQIFSQEITENNVDEFTGDSIKRTSWELATKSSKMMAYFRFSKINNTYIFDLKLMANSSLIISKGDELMLKLSNGKIITLENNETKVSCLGCGAKGFAGSQAPGIEVSYYITPEQLLSIRKNNPNKIRIYTNEGYIENDITKKYYTKILKAVMLIQR